MKKLLIVAAVFFVLSRFSDEPNNNGGSGNSDNPDWLDDYTPVHSIGTGSDKFLINFPSGQNPDHLTWITEALEEKPVFFVCHRTGCYGCSAQADRVIALGEKYAEDAIFYDLDYPYTQYGTATEDILNKFIALGDVREYCGLRVEQSLNTRYGDDDDPELITYENYKNWK